MHNESTNFTAKEKKEKKINIIYCNINGIRSKAKSLEELTKMEEADIIIITETKSQPPALEGFTWIDRNREKGKGGGVAIGIRNKVGCQVNKKEIGVKGKPEVIWAEIKGTRNQPILIGGFYGPQENKRKEEVTDIYEQLKEQVTTANPGRPIILVGDFNAKIQIEKDNQVIQKESKNGKIMQDFLDETGFKVLNQTAKIGTWTRVNRKNPRERSIIDYITTNSEGEKIIRGIEIDEIGTKRLKNTEAESDHNTISFKISLEEKKERTKIKKWNIKEDTNWTEYNRELTKRMENKERTYDNLKNAMVEAMEKTIGLITITTSNRRKRESKEVKEKREKKKERKKEWEKAPKETKEIKLQEYYAAQRELRETIANEETQKAVKTLEVIAKEPNLIWKIRKKLLGKKKEEPDIITEEGITLKDPEAAKEHIAKYYENLYQAREGTTEGSEWTKKIMEKNKDTKDRLDRTETTVPINIQEMKCAKKKLKKKKSSGPDNIPNEPIINLDHRNTGTMLECMNNIMKEKIIPGDWKKGRIISIYKGKGTRGKCSSERGITIGSNMGKFFERIINERAKEQLHITDYQGGGKRGASTVDHLTVVHETIRIGKKVYVTFLDVTKAYDKAWADGIMYVLEKEGIKDTTWSLIRKLNEDLTAQIETKHGTTRVIRMKDNIRQGGVLSVIMYAALMDEIAKEIDKRGLGVTIAPNRKIGCLLWMDDVVFITEKHQEMQEMLDIAHTAATRYRLKFGEEKSKSMTIGMTPNMPSFKLGEMEIGTCSKYKYLGVTLSEKGNMEEHMEETKRKTQGAYNTVMAIAGSANLKCIEMRTIWKTTKASIIPIITYGWEARCPTKKEESKLATILNSILKRILMVPKSTPNEIVYAETGIMEIDLTLQQLRINYMEKVRNSKNVLLQTIQNIEENKGWWKKNEETRKELVSWDDQEKISKKRSLLHKALKEKMLNRIKQEGGKKTKTKYYLENKKDIIIGKSAKYMDICTRMEASIIIAARARMIECKGNYKNKYPDQSCRWCRTGEETQEHILEECDNIDRTNIGKITKDDIFEECPMKLKNTAKKLQMLKEIQTSAAP